MYTPIPLISIIALVLTSVSRPAFGAQIPELSIGLDNYKNPNPPDGPADVDHSAVISQVEARSWTNARRLANHLPLKPPHRRQLNVGLGLGVSVDLGGDGGNGNGGTPTNPPNPFQSLLPGGCIQVMNSNTGSLLGFIGDTLNQHGASTIVPDLVNCLGVNLPNVIAGLTFDLRTENGQDASLPFLGVALGYNTTVDNIKSGTSDYGVLTSVVQTPANSPVFAGLNGVTSITGVNKKIESNVWTFEASTGKLGLNWMNTDNTRSPLSVGLNDNSLFGMADMRQFSSTYGPTTPVDLHFFPTA